MDVEEGEERPISIKLQEIEETAYNGIRLRRAEGKFHFLCPDKARDMAKNSGIPFSVDSVGKWGNSSAWWNHMTRGERRTYRQYLSIETSSTIVNHYN